MTALRGDLREYLAQVPDPSGRMCFLLLSAEGRRHVFAATMCLGEAMMSFP